MSYVTRKCGAVHTIVVDGITKVFRCKLAYSHRNPVFPSHYLEHQDRLFKWMEKRDIKSSATP